MSKKTIEQLRQELAEAEAAEKKERAAKRAHYEAGRDDLINELAGEAYKIAAWLMQLKTDAVTRLNEHRERMLEYGDLRRGAQNKGSFELKNDQWKVQFSSQTVKRFDERAYIAEKKVNEFLKSFLRKKDKGTYELITGLLKRDEETGQFDIDMINRLYKYEDSFDDPNWQEGIKLFKEAYSPTGTAQYVRFYQKNEETGAWENLVLDFAKAKTTTGGPAASE
ncbi:MAG: DUF3164 family protein [Edaphocola sp.]